MPKPCKVPGCEGGHRVHLGLCQKHYARLRRLGSTELRSKVRPMCRFPGCDRPFRSMGYCSKHYERFLKYGDPAALKFTRRFMAAPLGAERHAKGGVKVKTVHGWMSKNRVEYAARNHVTVPPNRRVWKQGDALMLSRGRPIYQCLFCKESFSPGRWWAKRQRFCSRVCFSTFRVSSPMKNWKSVIERLNYLIKGHGSRAWEVATNLKFLWTSDQFLVHCGDRLAVEERLAKYADAIGYHLNDLLQMIEHFPSKADWKDGQLRELYDETCRLIAKKRKPYADGEKVHRDRVTRAQYDALLKKYKAAQAELRRLRKIVESNPKLRKVA
jgi:hypothetical protein